MRVPTLTARPLPPGHARAAEVLADLHAAGAADLADFLGALDAVRPARPMPPTPSPSCGSHDHGMWLPASAGLASVPLVPMPDAEPLTQADWSAQLAEAFGAVNSALTWLASNTQACIEQAAYTEYYAANGLHEACVVVKAEVGGWRREVATLAPVETMLKGSVAP